MDCSELVRAVIVYMRDNYPTDPEEFNFQAELKAACHWYWHKDHKETELVPGPHDDCRIKTAAMKTLTTWNSQLEEIAKSRKDSHPDTKQRISGLG